MGLARTLVLLCLTSLLTVSFAASAKSKSKSKKSKPKANIEASVSAPAHTSKIISAKKTSSRSNDLYLRFGGVMWQESIKVSNSVAEGKMETQSQGFTSSVVTSYPLMDSRRWYQAYSADFAFGYIKGRANGPAITDELKGQLWLMGGVSPGLLYRTSPVSSVGLMAPLAYRHIEWKLKGGSSFNPEGASSFSIGVSGVYINHFTKNSSLLISITQHTMWSAVAWGLTWQYKL